MRLSELKDTDILMVNRELISKEDLINNFAKYKGLKVYSTEEYRPSIDIIPILRRALIEESLLMYRGWYTEMKNLITEQDEKYLQRVIDKLLSRNKGVRYFKDDEVKIDM